MYSYVIIILRLQVEGVKMLMIDLDKKDLKWLQKALSKKDPRAYLSQIIVKDGYAYATNGHVLHRVLMEHRASGVQKYNYDGQFIVDDESIHPLEKIDLFDIYWYTGCSLSLMPTKLDVLKLSGAQIGINKKYFDNTIDKVNNITLQSNEEQNKILIKYDNRAAIIMGVRL